MFCLFMFLLNVSNNIAFMFYSLSFYSDQGCIQYLSRPLRYSAMSSCDVMHCTKKNQQSIILMMPPATSLSTILIPKLKLQVVLARPFHLDCHVIYCTNCNKKQNKRRSLSIH